MKHTDSYTSFISRPEISFWVPIVVAVVTVSATYGLLLTRVSVLETKVDSLLTNQDKFFATLDKQMARDNNMEFRITALETVNNLRK